MESCGTVPATLRAPATMIIISTRASPLLRMRITPRGDPIDVNSVIIMQRVLLLGSGRTCPPLVELLTRDRCVQVTIGKA